MYGRRVPWWGRVEQFLDRFQDHLPHGNALHVAGFHILGLIHRLGIGQRPTRRQFQGGAGLLKLLTVKRLEVSVWLQQRC